MAGFEHLYRQGYGDSTVLNFGNVVNTYAQQLAMDAQKRQKEREAYAKELESISWEGARPADEEHFRKSWETVLDLNHKRSTTDKKEERIALSGQIASLKKQMMADAKRSVLENATDADIAKMPLNKDIDELPDSFGDLLKARRSISTFNPSFNEYGTDKFMVQPKPYDINADIMNTANIAANEVNEEYTIGSGIDARRGYREGKLLNEAKFKELILNRIATNPAAKRAYLQGAEPTPENLELAASAAYEAVKDKFSLKSREGNYIDPSGRQLSLAESTAKINARYRVDDGNSGGGDSNPVDIEIPFGNGASFKAKGYVPIPITKKNFAGSNYIDLKTGRPGTGKLASSNDYEIVGVTNTPIIKSNSGADKKLWGSIAQPNFEESNPNLIEYKPMIHVQKLIPGLSGYKEDHLIPYDRFPENVKSTKAIKNALSNFKPGARPGGETQPVKVDIKSLRDKYNY